MKKRFGGEGREREEREGGVFFIFFLNLGSQLDIDMWQERVESDHIRLF